jgi:hypothetical protein
MVKYFDGQGDEQDWDQLITDFGNVDVKETPEGVYRLLQVRAEDGPNSITVRVVDANNHAVPGVPICWSWPDAPPESGAGWEGKAVVEATDATGCVRFNMGRESFYKMPGPGPHAIWIYGRKVSDRIGGLGMVGGTNHLHLNVTFIQATTLNTDTHWVSLFTKLDRIIELLGKTK